MEIEKKTKKEKEERDRMPRNILYYNKKAGKIICIII